jgi:hypothetical protein
VEQSSTDRADDGYGSAASGAGAEAAHAAGGARSRAASLLIALAALASLAWSGLWALGTLVGDRTEALQYVAYVPGAVWAGGAAGLALVAGVLAAGRWWLSGRGAGRAGLSGWLARSAVLVAGLALAVAGTRDLRVQNWLLGPAETDPARTISLVHWNTGSIWRDAWPEVKSAIADLAGPADIVVLSNPPQPSRLPGLAELIGGDARAAGTAATGEPAADEADTRFLAGGFVVASRFKVLSSGWFPLDLPRPTVEHYPTFLPPGSLLGRLARRVLPLRTPVWVDGGDVGFVELDTSALLGRNLVLWMIDLPSDPRLPRAAVMVATAARLRGLRAEGRLPDADVLVGDFNIPRGAWTLAGIVGAARREGEAMADAFGQASWGLHATWPRTRPALGIDHVFLAPWLRASAYRVEDGGLSDHLFQVARIGPAR